MFFSKNLILPLSLRATTKFAPVTTHDTRLLMISPILTSNRKVSSIIEERRHAKAAAVGSPSETKSFVAIFPELVQQLTDSSRFPAAEKATQWLRKVLKYNMPGGKMYRGLTVVKSYKMLMGKDLSDEGLFLAQVAGWGVEMMETWFLIADDIMDDSKTRRNKPCWFRTHNLGAKATNDVFLIDSCIYQLLRKYMGNKAYYKDIVELFHNTIFKSALGQSMDLHTVTEENRPKFEIFNIDYYRSIAKYKTSYSTFPFLVRIAMYMAGIDDERLHQQVENVFLEVGILIQVRDDYLDCFGDPDVTGKVGTDIENGKCSWVVVTALQHANEKQRKIIQDCYGYSDSGKVACVKKLYKELDIPAIFSAYEEEAIKNISAQVKLAPANFPDHLLYYFLDNLDLRIIHTKYS